MDIALDPTSTVDPTFVDPQFAPEDDRRYASDGTTLAISPEAVTCETLPDIEREMGIDSLSLEVRNSLEIRRAVTNGGARRIRRYIGKNYRSDMGPESLDSFYETHYNEWVSIMVPHLVITNPAVKITDMGLMDPETKDLQLAMRSLLPQIRFERALRAVALDLQFDFGVMMVRMEETPGLKVESSFIPMRPMAERISPRCFFTDAKGAMLGRARFEGHLRYAHAEDLKAETVTDQQGQTLARYDAQLIDKYAGAGDTDALKTQLMQEGIEFDAENPPLIVAEVWIAKHNTIMTAIWSGDRLVPLETPKPYIGPRRGPYVLFGLQYVPDQVFPISPLAIAESQVEELTRHRTQAAVAAEKAKRNTIVDGAETRVLEALRDSQDGDYLSIKDFSGKVHDHQQHGVMPETMDYIERAKQRLNMTTGLNDVMRGDVNGEATATEIAQAGGFADVRLKDAQNCFRDGVKETLARIAELMLKNDDVVFPVTVADENAGEEVMLGIFQGGEDRDTTQPWPFERSLTIEIEPYSMEHTNQPMLRAQMMAFQNEAVKIAQASLMMPFLNGRAMINDLGSQFNMTGSGSRYIDWNVLEQMRLAMTLRAAMGGGAGAGGASNGTEDSAAKTNRASAGPPSPGQRAAPGVPRPRAAQAVGA